MWKGKAVPGGTGLAVSPREPVEKLEWREWSDTSEAPVPLVDVTDAAAAAASPPVEAASSRCTDTTSRFGGDFPSLPLPVLFGESATPFNVSDASAQKTDT